MENARSAFRMHIAPDEFLERVKPTQALRDIVGSSTAVVSPRDINHLPDVHADPLRISIRAMHMEDLLNIFKKVTNLDGKRVYEQGDISTGRVSPSVIYHGQTFVQAEKIVGLGELKRLFEHFDNSGVSKTPASVITYRGDKESYVALYFPAIVEYMNKNSVEPLLANLRERVKTESTLRLNAFPNGSEGVLSLKKIVTETEALLDNSNVQIIPMLRDGTHRSHTTNVAGTTMHAIIINGSSALPTGLPIRPREMVVTSGKPKNKQDRFLGNVPQAWLNYQDFGIDG